MKMIALESRKYNKHAEECDWLNSKGIKYLFHYTDITNLSSILNEGYLYSRTAIENKNIYFLDGASNFIINHTDDVIKNSVRFYYKENTPTLYASEGIRKLSDFESGHRPIPVALLFDRAILFHDNVHFLSGSGGNLNNENFRTTMISNFNLAKDFDWDTILFRGKYSEDPSYDKSKDFNYNKRNLNNIRNAEFLYPEKISTTYIKKIIFRTLIDKRRTTIECGYDSRFEVDKNYFNKYDNCAEENYRNGKPYWNYLTNWQILPNENNTTLIQLEFLNNHISDYDLKLIINKKEFKVIKRLNDKTITYIINEKYQDIKNIKFLMDGILCAIWENKDD